MFNIGDMVYINDTCNSDCACKCDFSKPVKVVKNDGHAFKYQVDISEIMGKKGTFENTCYFSERSLRLAWRKDDEKTMTKDDLKIGMMVEIRNGKKFLYVGEGFTNDDTYLLLKFYNDDLTRFSPLKLNTQFDIMKVYDMQLANLNYMFCSCGSHNLIWERKEISEPKFEVGGFAYDIKHSGFMKISGKIYNHSKNKWMYQVKYYNNGIEVLKEESELGMP